ncbi:unnamed protein product [Didymodactylos carnosus]|uniref:PHD-type domain-containing protein n=1 Tax=Didymodactylos carnosus TaxID=1234261 RepID=A0A815Z0I6_9BILA|nr:unnamed protein product [Didymodactylos carnosus]CAF4445162.1 unnamed protein product [Didymodactylos carnosus]
MPSAPKRPKPNSPRSQDNQRVICSCQNTVNDDANALCCDRCNKWFHIGCVNVSIPAYKAYQTLADEKQYSNWFCPSCEPAARADLPPPQCLQMLAARIDKIEHQLIGISDLQQLITSRLNELVETTERDKRNKNIVVKNIFPVALNSNRPPIIGVSFNDLCIRSSILSKASALKKSSDVSVRSVFIGKHLTKLQSQSAYETRQQRKIQQNNHQQQSANNQQHLQQQSENNHQQQPDNNQQQSGNIQHHPQQQSAQSYPDSPASFVQQKSVPDRSSRRLSRNNNIIKQNQDQNSSSQRNRGASLSAGGYH